MSTTPDGAPVKHTGDPATVNVTVPAGAPAVSAPRTVTPDQAPPASSNGSQPPPQGPQVASHMGDPRQPQYVGPPPADAVHPEVLQIETLMDLHQAQLRTQKMLMAVGVMILGAAIIVTVARSRAQLADLADEIA